MSKFSKILAVLMSVCLLFGATTAFLASADAESPDTGVVDGVKSNLTKHTNNSNKVPFGQNTYTADWDIRTFDYFTVDMDLTLPEGYESYPQAFKISPQRAIKDGGNSSLLSYIYFYKHNDGFYYLGFANNASSVSEAARISCESGVYDHITVVYKVVRNEGAITGIDLMLYVNGNYVDTENCELTSQEVSLSRFSVQGNQLTKSTDWNEKDESDAFKKVYGASYSYIGKGYKTGDYSGTKALADIVEDTSKNLYDSTSDAVIYNAYYVLPNSDYVIAVDGKKFYIPDAAETALSSINDGAEIETKVDVVDFDIPDGVEKFTLTYNPEETEFSICEDDAKEFFIIKNGETTYTVRKSTENDKLMLKRVVEYGDKELVISSAEFIFLLAPENDVTFTYFDLNGLKLYTGTVANWSIDVDGDVPEAINLYDPEAIRGLSDSEAALIREEFDGILIASATAEDGAVEFIDFSDYAYIAGYEKNGVFTPIEDSDGGYENYKDIATFEAEKATWDSDVVYYEIVDGKATLPEGSAAQGASAIWNSSSNQLTGTTDTAVSAGVTNIVKNSFKDNGTVDGYGILIIR